MATPKGSVTEKMYSQPLCSIYTQYGNCGKPQAYNGFEDLILIFVFIVRNDIIQMSLIIRGQYLKRQATDVRVEKRVVSRCKT
jgi:hypothetical protein